MKKILVICDEEENYMRQLTRYWIQKEQMVLQIEAFTEWELLKCFLDEYKIDLLLISCELFREELYEYFISKIILLSSEKFIQKQETKAIPVVFKYQAANHLIKEVMELYLESQNHSEWVGASTEKSKLISIFSPVKRIYKTAFSLAFCQYLSKQYKVLYITLESFSGFSKLLQKEYSMDISDLIYYYREKKEGILLHLNTIVEKLNDFYYIPPSACPEDMRSVSNEEWISWFTTLVMKSGYEFIIIEPGMNINGWENILDICDTVYMPIKNDLISCAKYEEYQNYMRITGRQSVLEKTRELQLPILRFEGQENNFKELIASEKFMEIIESLLNKESGNIGGLEKNSSRAFGSNERAKR